MRVEVFLQSAAIKILRQKLSQASFSAGFPFRFKMAEVLFSSTFYLLLLAALALCAFFVRLIGTTSEPEPKPDTETPPKQGKSPPTSEVTRSKHRKLDDNKFDQQKDLSRNPPSKFENAPKPEKGNPVTLAGSKTIQQSKTLMLKATQSETVATRSALSLLTTYLLKDKRHVEAHSSTKFVPEKLGRKDTRMLK